MVYYISMRNIRAKLSAMIAVAMAEGRQTKVNAACRFANITDACCLAGVRFPRNLNRDVVRLLDWFNNSSSKMCEWGNENAEVARYCMIGEVLVKILEEEPIERIREFVTMRLGKIRKEVRENTTGRHNYDDRYGFDSRSKYLKNNWGYRRDEEESEEDLDW